MHLSSPRVGLAAIHFLTAVFLTAETAAAAPVQWLRFDSGCSFHRSEIVPSLQEPELTEMPCGAYGRFVFGAPGFTYNGLCPNVTGTEEPPLYIEGSGEDHPTLPCRNGSCLGRGTGPWVAVVDWDQPHGWTVAETVLQASDRRVSVELFDLADPQGRVPSWLQEVGDAHVLAQVCAVAESAIDPADAPLAINLSFGRASALGSPCSATQPRLACEIERVLHHLDDAGTLPVAAAGNQRRLLFPASSADVLAAGALDLAWFRQTGLVRPSSETPPQAEVLAPGYGLYLTRTSWQMDFWAAPAGSSYASALTSGWIAGARAAAALAEPPSALASLGVWAPSRCGDRYCLARGSEVFPGSASLAGPSLLLARALGETPAVCATDSESIAAVVLQQPANNLPTLTLPDVVETLHCTQPGSHPCVPCHGGNSPFAGKNAEIGLIVNLEDSEGLPEAHEIHGLYLQIGATVYHLDRSHDPVLLDAFARGELPALRILGAGGTIQPGQQLSLVYALETQGVAFRDSTPIHVHTH